MTKEEFCKNYWSYYLVLEGRFLKLQNYIAFDKENYKCYSTELIAQFQTICSEVDVVSKILCGFDAADEKTMDDYRAQYTLRCPGIEAQEVAIDYFDVKVQPFKALATEHSFPWWTDYNKVKHSRVTSYQRGNLKNVMFALAGLYVLEKEIYKIITSEEKMISESEIMHMVGWHESVNILFWLFEGDTIIAKVVDFYFNKPMSSCMVITSTQAPSKSSSNPPFPLSF